MSSSSISKMSNASKSPSASTSTTPTVSAAQHFFTTEAKRPSISTASSTARNTPSPRNNQTSKSRHKSGKRFKPLPDDDADAEMYSMQNPHGRRGQQSITHLMQFSLPPRPSNTTSRHIPTTTQRKRTWGLGSGYHAMDKARYIHANYRFIVTPSGDYHAHTTNADSHLDWTSVLQIIASSKTQASSCPICLGDPVAPRMAKCGHIFCLPCLIRYMHSEDATSSPVHDRRPRSKKCPICWDSIYITETRPVRWYAGNENEPPQENGDVVLRLCRRRAESTLAMPRDSAPLDDSDVPWFHAAEVMDYARIMRGSEEYMIDQYDEAIAAVRQLEKEDELMFGEDSEWTGRARRMLYEAKDKVKGIGSAPTVEDKPVSTITTSIQSVSIEPDSAVPRTLTEMRQRHTDKPPPPEYLFYHALQHFYLSALDIRILKAAFGSYSAFPSSILPKVERVSTGHIVDDDLRRRCKYLAHLPSGCEVGFLECDWTDTVPASVLAEFDSQIKKRRARNEEKEAREEKEKIRIQKDAEKEYAALRRPRRTSIPHAFSADQLPTLSESLTDVATSPPWPRRAHTGFSSLASPSTSPSTNRTVWGTAIVPAASPEQHATLPSDSDFAQDDGWLQGWERDLLGEVEIAPPSGGKKSKKKNKITLMSTTNARRAA